MLTNKTKKLTLKPGISWLRLKRPVTVILIWLSERCGKADFSRFATKPWKSKIWSSEQKRKVHEAPKKLSLQMQANAKDPWQQKE